MTTCISILIMFVWLSYLAQSSFPCGDLGIIGFPFFDGRQSEWGLFELDCNNKKIKLGIEQPQMQWYNLLTINRDKTLVILDTSLQALLDDRSCYSFENITLPSSPSISYSITNSKKTFVKCIGNSKLVTNHFSSYYNFTGCPGYTMYYTTNQKGDNGVFSAFLDFPPTCNVFQLPLDKNDGENDTLNPFDRLTAYLTIKWQVSDECNECFNSGGECNSTENQKEFQCIEQNQGTRTSDHTKASNGTRSGPTEKLLIGSFATSGAAIMTVIIVIFSLRRKIANKWKKKTDHDNNFKIFIETHGSLTPKSYRYKDIKKMTNSFKDKLGEGGYGSVYKGKLSNDNLVAVKIIKESKGNGEEFFNEVVSISRTSHVNVVTLVGFCSEGRKRALIYEFMPNGSLDKFIYDGISSTNSQLGWTKSFEIAKGIARGLEYLHRGCNTRIVHFDIKPHNILLDEDFIPKISDFGLAKLCPGKESAVSMMDARGTIGYIAPEVYCRNFGRVSHKSDVYSYGMMILELVGKRKNIQLKVGHTSEIYFPDWIYAKLKSDEELGMDGIMNEDENVCARKMIVVSLWCIQSDPSTRPSMSRVVEMLEGSLESLELPPKPVLSSPQESPSHFSIIELR